MVKSGENFFPIRLQSLDLCNPMVIYPFVAPVVKAMLSLRLRQLLMVHRGTSERVLESLNACSLPNYCVPSNLGGNLCVSLETFVAARLIIEGSGRADEDVDISSNSSISISDFSMMSQSDIMEAQPLSSDSAKSSPMLITSCSSQANLPQTSIPQASIRSEERKMKFKMHPESPC